MGANTWRMGVIFTVVITFYWKNWLHLWNV